MSIIVNGTTIPTTLGSIKVGSTNITKVNVVSGSTTTTVWEVITEQWIVKNGVLQSIVTSPSFTYEGYSMSTDTLDSNVWGIGGHVNGNGNQWIIKTGNINTKGSTTLEITVYGNMWGDGRYKYLYTKILSGTTVLYTKTEASETIVNDQCTMNGRYTYSFNISGYSTINIQVETNDLSTSNNWINFGIASAVMK